MTRKRFHRFLCIIVSTAFYLSVHLFTTSALAGDALSPFLGLIVPSKNFGMICSPTGPLALSHPLLRGQTRGVGLLPPIEIETAPGHSQPPPDVSRNCVAKRLGQSVFGSLVCPGGGQGGLGAGNLSRFSSEPSRGHGSALSHWMGRLSRQNFWGIQYSRALS